MDENQTDRQSRLLRLNRDLRGTSPDVAGAPGSRCFIRAVGAGMGDHIDSLYRDPRFGTPLGPTDLPRVPVRLIRDSGTGTDGIQYSGAEHGAE